MKFYSEVLDKFFDTPEVLIDAETQHLERIAKEEEALANKKNAESARKKELANAIDEADKELDVAYKKMEKAEASCLELYKKYQEEVKAIMQSAKSDLAKAQAKRLDAIREFNKEFGAFKTAYTGERAEKEWLRTVKAFDDLFNRMFR